ncbi:type 1 glutamine amidotransferase [uncultured Comamonas sp.]|uniref:type 1 glutamine amidotransferase n=1 Tax=uncultured Comamonas sp. TaxID=114710 RepID=UPI0026185135|nr:type 1 glutamine amidotransferase [uncultured Comamonas sp.]
MIWCADAPGDEEWQGKIISTFGRKDEQWDVLHPARDNFLEQAAGYAGYVISGSPQSVVDDAQTPLVRNLIAFLQAQAQRGDAPVVGLCFGSQAIAAALGGQVGKNPSGRFKLGVDQLQWGAQAQALIGAQGGGGPTSLVQSHGECVTRLPSEAVALASSATIAHEVFLVDGRFLGIQGHPEVDRRFLQEKFMAYHRALFDDEQWVCVQEESRQPLDADRVIALGRRLLDAGRLPTAATALDARPSTQGIAP